MWLILAFVALGFLIGNLIGFSASSSVPAFLGLLFALLGGSLVALLKGLDDANRRVAGQAVLALSLACLSGVYCSVAVNERQLLTPKELRFHAAALGSSSAPATSSQPPNPPRGKYLAAGIASQARMIDWQRRTGKLSLADAYNELLSISLQFAPDQSNTDEH
jgi:hypothetical protein